MADARCPASCGELIQGWILGSEKLISCPIDWYSQVSVTEGTPQQDERPRMRQMAERVLNYFGEPPELSANLCIEFESTIPVAKGMASSTADIAATAKATAKLLGQSLDNDAIARLCVQLEPTDSTIFDRLTLFDHQTALTRISFSWVPEIDILLLESPLSLLTEDYHRLNRHQLLLNQAGELEKSWQQFRLADEKQDCFRLGEATTLSAVASQSILPKPQFQQLMELVEQSGIYGLNVAHSGSVVGLLLDSSRHDVDYLRWSLSQTQIIKHYPHLHLVKMTSGGVR
ncbi:GHMP family kinase ATP-binding protein [Budvicia aquatica]|uniref:GHMP family kinase ATP-binding protein n=1 Tax=Budvicia aquatica TaxID=82979 RepID=UPI002081532C|nr:GHMP kinase [Budvicia aquatica]GKX51756.1 GHMP kinase [Budvicia aquatica]